jgi:hypothetical protein
MHVGNLFAKGYQSSKSTRLGQLIGKDLNVHTNYGRKNNTTKYYIFRMVNVLVVYVVRWALRRNQLSQINFNSQTHETVNGTYFALSLNNKVSKVTDVVLTK